MYSTPPESHDATRLTVADILSTMANSVDAMTPTTLQLLDGLTGVPTRTTPTLTPTTLRNIEQTFMDLAANQISHEREAGFVPPLLPPSSSFNNNSLAPSSNYTVTVTTSTQQGNAPNEDAKPHWVGVSVSQACTSPPVAVSTRNGGNSTGRRMSVGSNSSGSSNHSGYSSAAVSYGSGGGTSTKRGGGRRKEDRNEYGEDTGKRLMRRERNKQAAARCRKRRLDHTMALQQETELWEEKKQNLQNEIRQLQKDREELEQLLESHRPQCKMMRLSNKGANGQDISMGQQQYNLQCKGSAALPAMPDLIAMPIKEERREDDMSDESSLSDDGSFQNQRRVEQFTRPTVAAPARPRPTSLPVASPFQPASAPLIRSSNWNEIAGIAITTPSSGIPGFNFDSLMEGGTGLTPVVPSPSCTTQQQKGVVSTSLNTPASLPVDLSSPDAVNRKLVSL